MVIMANRHRPLRLLQAQEEIRHLGDHIRVAHLVQDRDHHLVVEHRPFDGVAEHFEVLAGHPGVFDLGQAPFVGVGVQELTGHDILGRRLAAQVLGFGVDAVKEGGGDLALHVHVRFLQVLGQDGRSGAVLVTQVQERHPLVGAVGWMMVDHHGGREVLGQGVVNPPWLGINQRDLRVSGKIDLPDRHQVDVQVAKHCLVLGPPNDSPQGNHNLLALQGLTQNEAQRRGAGQSVRIRVVVRKNDQRGGAFCRSQQLV